MLCKRCVRVEAGDSGLTTKMRSYIYGGFLLPPLVFRCSGTSAMIPLKNGFLQNPSRSKSAGTLTTVVTLGASMSKPESQRCVARAPFSVIFNLWDTFSYSVNSCKGKQEKHDGGTDNVSVCSKNRPVWAMWVAVWQRAANTTVIVMSAQIPEITLSLPGSCLTRAESLCSSLNCSQQTWLELLVVIVCLAQIWNADWGVIFTSKVRFSPRSDKSD